jgi:hypothetical protein
MIEARVTSLRQTYQPAQGHHEQPSAPILDHCPLQADVESGQRVGSNGAKRLTGSKVHLGVNPSGHLLVLHKTARRLDHLACVDQGDTGEQAAQDAGARGICLTVVDLPEAKQGFLLMPPGRGVPLRLAGPLSSPLTQ